MSKQRDDVLAWLDVETTGLNPWTGDRLLQVACIVTGPRLDELDEPREWVVRHAAAEVEAMKATVAPFVAAMHEATGLWDRLPGGTELAEVDGQLLDLLTTHSTRPRQVRLAGNSVKLDFDFVDRFLPRSAAWLHYRVVDVTGIAWAARSLGWVGEAPAKRRTHNAVDDIRESLDELRWIDARIAERRAAAGVAAQAVL